MPRQPGRSHGRIAAPVAILAAFMLSASACSSEADVVAAEARVAEAEAATAEATETLEGAGVTFCEESKDYIAAIDRYGKVFNDDAATVGDLETMGADLVAPREATVAAAQDVLDAHDALNEANQELADARVALAEAQAAASGKTKEPKPPPASSSPSVPAASVDMVKEAESDLEAAMGGITDETLISQATETFTSAAFALEAAWLNLFLDAGCLTDEQSEQAVAAVRSYTLALQTDLKTAGFLEGEPDGVYGPDTVAAVEDLQADAGLPVTGLVDVATRAALDEALAREGQADATQAQIQATSVQTTLKLAGYWPGPIDGVWTPELEAALKDFQRDLGVEPTGTVDAATLAALEDALVTLSTPVPTPSPTVSASATPA